jgi:uncharacterized protein (TIGR00661 family)
MARAEDIIPLLKQYGDLDLFVSGSQADIKLSYPVKYKSKGLSFYFGKTGGVDIFKTFKKNNSREIFKEIKKFPSDKYDVVINDFEPISAWSAQRNGIPCIALSHQSALLSLKVPKPKHFDPVGEWIIKHYAPTNAQVSFHFSAFDKNMFTPVIRKAVRECAVKDKGHYTVYLPAYDDKKLIPLLSRFSKTKWEIFSKHAKKTYHIGKLSIYPVNNEEFTSSMASSTGVLCGAGFETPAEALYLQKKLMIVPMKKQYEQHYNAAALKLMGVPILKKVKKKYLDTVEEWIESDERVNVDYKDIASDAVKKAMSLLPQLK